jgi:hypothetical protein
VIEIRPGTDADRPQILARIAEVFGPEPAARADRLWDWQWHQDPRLASPGYRGVVAQWQGEIIGNLATIPAGLYIGGEPAVAHWCVDVLIHWGLTKGALREQRRAPDPGGPDLSRGLAAALLDHPAAGPIQLSKHLSDPITKIVERIGFHPWGETASLHRRVSLRHALGRGLGRVLGDSLGAVADLTLARIPSTDPRVQVLDGPFDRRFDALWERIKRRYPAIPLRDSATLQWRYRQHPDGGYTALTLDSDQGLAGYCVLLDYDKGRRRWGKIVDLIVAPGDRAGMRALLAGALRLMRQRRVERAETFACGADAGAVLAGLGFVPRLPKSGRPQPLMVRWLPDCARGIYVAQGDGDGG